MSAFPPEWLGKEQIAMLIYPEFTALDLVGPHYMFTSLWGAKVHLVAASKEPVRSDAGLSFIPDLTLAEAPADLDILFVPGGSQGTLKVMQDPKQIAWIADRARRAKLIASVCTGAMILGQAGLLRGKRATTHWATHALLKDFGAVPVDERVVWDGTLVTGAGVSAGLDLGLSVVARLRDKPYAQGVQLLAEYAPQPPFNAGTPKTAPTDVHRMMGSMFDALRADMRASAKTALGS
ncbi:DJ-1/PfpI family protein [Piscinibacter sakaiensis]|nr:DJ-1/PfpI family protein [Piscinibacter sakaiensis]